MNRSNKTIAKFCRDEAEIIHRFNEIDPDKLCKNSLQYFSSPTARAEDLGVEVGRDARWQRKVGLQMTAEEPVAEPRQHVMALQPQATRPRGARRGERRPGEPRR